MNKMLITGSSGFIGKALSARFEKLYKIIEHGRGDQLTDLLKTYNPDVIINCAADIYVSSRMYDSNVALTYECLKYVIDRPWTKMIQFGSSSEYGPTDHPTSENTLLKPIDAYQGTKAAASMLCQGFARHYSLNLAIIRPYSVYGAGEKPHRLFPMLWKAAKRGEKMTLHNGHHDFIYIEDFVRGVELILDRKNEPGEVFNLGSGVQVSNFEVLEAFEDVIGLDLVASEIVEKVETMKKAFESEVWVADMSSTSARLNFSCRFTLKDGIKDFLDKAKY